MYKYFFLIVLTFLTTSISKAQSIFFNDSILIQTKIWSRDSNRKIQYSDWKSFSSHTVEMLDGFVPEKKIKSSKYGGDANIKLNASGYFRTEKVNGRWSVIDPDGHPFIVSAMNSFRQGKSPNNEKAFNEKFGSVNKWVDVSIQTFQNLGFNTAGSWSEIGPIIEFNKTAKKPFAYTTQLSLLANYVRLAVKKAPERKEASVLSFIMDDAFVVFCNEQSQKLAANKNDANLLGHFSDNEIAFMHTEFKDILLISDKSDKCLIAAKQWMSDKGVDEKTITREQKEEFIGMITGIYYKTVSSAIKKYDPNHLYLGSRLHSSAKNNKFIFASAEPYIDIISINYYGYWQPQQKDVADWENWSSKPFFITEFYTKAEDSGMPNVSGAGWLVKTQEDRGIHYQNFTMQLLMSKNCVGWHWFRYQDNDPNDTTADPSNNDSNKGIVNTQYQVYGILAEKMKSINDKKYQIIKYFDSFKK
jgi:hypothetical protein